MQAKARLRRAAAQATHLHDQLAGVEAEAGKPEDAAAERADIVLRPLDIALAERRGAIGVEDPEFAAMQERDPAFIEGDRRQAVQQSMGDRRSTRRAADDRNFRRWPAGEKSGDLLETARGEHIARLHQAIARRLDERELANLFVSETFGGLMATRRDHEVARLQQPGLPGAFIANFDEPAILELDRLQGAVARQHLAFGFGVDHPRERVTYETEKGAGITQADRPVPRGRDLLRQWVALEARNFARLVGQQAVDEGAAAAVGVDGVTADRPGAESIAFLDDRDTTLQKLSELAHPMGGQQRSHSARTAANNDKIETRALLRHRNIRDAAVVHDQNDPKMSNSCVGVEDAQPLRLTSSPKRVAVSPKVSP